MIKCFTGLMFSRFFLDALLTLHKLYEAQLSNCYFVLCSRKFLRKFVARCKYRCYICFLNSTSHVFFVLQTVDVDGRSRLCGKQSCHRRITVRFGLWCGLVNGLILCGVLAAVKRNERDLPGGCLFFSVATLDKTVI